MAVWEDMVGDTLKIYAGYYDGCSNEHRDSIGVIVEDEIQN